jgi:hypothetical protein
MKSPLAPMPMAGGQALSDEQATWRRTHRSLLAARRSGEFALE